MEPKMKDIKRAHERFRDVIPSSLPPLAAVRGRVVEAYREERERDALRRGIAVLRRRYAIRIAVGGDSAGAYRISEEGSAS